MDWMKEVQANHIFQPKKYNYFLTCDTKTCVPVLNSYIYGSKNTVQLQKFSPEIVAERITYGAGIPEF